MKLVLSVLFFSISSMASPELVGVNLLQGCERSGGTNELRKCSFVEGSVIRGMEPVERTFKVNYSFDCVGSYVYLGLIANREDGQDQVQFQMGKVNETVSLTGNGELKTIEFRKDTHPVYHASFGRCSLVINSVETDLSLKSIQEVKNNLKEMKELLIHMSNTQLLKFTLGNLSNQIQSIDINSLIKTVEELEFQLTHLVEATQDEEHKKEIEKILIDLRARIHEELALQPENREKFARNQMNNDLLVLNNSLKIIQDQALTMFQRLSVKTDKVLVHASESTKIPLQNEADKLNKQAGLK